MDRDVMRWFLFQKLRNGGWDPIFGPLSEFLGGALIYTVVLLVPVLLIWCAVRKMRLTGGEYRIIIWWAVAFWPLFALWGLPHAVPKATPLHTTSAVIAHLISLLWIIIGIWRIVPLLIRH